MKKSVVISALLYYAGWLGAILGAAQGEPLVGSMTVMAILLIGLIQGGRPEVGFAGLALLLGLGFETLLLELQWVAYSPEVKSPLGWNPPIWMLLLWPLLMRTLADGQCLAWTKGRWVVCIVFGAVGGGLAYYGGQSLGALQFLQEDKIMTAIGIGVGWGILFPALAMGRQYMETQLFMSDSNLKEKKDD